MLRAMRNRMGERGSAALEFALTMPVFLMVTAGVIEFGHAFQVRQNLVNAASEAARAGSQLTCPRPSDGEASAAAFASLSDAGLDPSLARIDLSNTGGDPGTDMSVTLAYDVYLPMLSNILHLTNLGPGGRLEVSVEVEAENE
jgi:Flp pilus assembly protein TadG